MDKVAQTLAMALEASQKAEEYAKKATHNARYAHMWAEESSMYTREAAALLADERAGA